MQIVKASDFPPIVPTHYHNLRDNPTPLCLVMQYNKNSFDGIGLKNTVKQLWNKNRNIK